jgi:putative membrane protein insertion efficiency factor
MSRMISTPLIGIIRLYKRWLSPMLPNACRFQPTCSSYAIEALQVHGALRGSVMALKRIGRCHPLHPGGYDPVPKRREAEAEGNLTEGSALRAREAEAEGNALRAREAETEGNALRAREAETEGNALRASDTL